MAQIEVMGRATKDPELKETKNGKKFVNIGLAENTGKGDDAKAVFYDLTFWEKKAELASKTIKKGQPLMISGTLSFEEYDGDNGVKVLSKKVSVGHFLSDQGEKRTKKQ